MEKVDVRYWTSSFRPEAAKVGAQAVVGLHWVRDVELKTYTATGLAVEYADSAFTTPCQCVVAIPRPANASDAKEGTRKDDGESLQQALTLELERRGYYAWAAEEPFQSAHAFSVEPLTVHLGLPVDLAFVSKLTFNSQSTAPKMSGVLVRMATGDTVWTTAGSDSLPRREAPPNPTETRSRGSFIGAEVGRVLQTLPSPPGVAQ